MRRVARHLTTTVVVVIVLWGSLHRIPRASGAPAPRGAASKPTTATGVFKDVTLQQRSPLSSMEESFRRTPRQFTGTKFQTFDEMSARERERLDYDLAKESVDILVPPSARDGSPQGLLVWLGVSTPDPRWAGALARRRLIFVTPNRCDGRSPWIKRGLAIDAVHDLSKQYNIDPARVYLGGFSAGAHASAALITQFPDVFHGTLCLMGGHYYRAAPSGGRGKPDLTEATMIGPHWYGDVERLKRELRLVSVFGGADDIVHATQGRVDHECLRLDGFQHTYIELRGQPHRYPDPATFQRALAALEAKPAPPPTTAPTTAPTRAGQPPHADQVAQAKRLLTTAKLVYEFVSRVPDDPKARAQLAELAFNDPAYDAALARRCLNDLLASYPTTPSAAEGRELLAKLDALAPTPAQTPTPDVPADKPPGQ
jgi:dienelactone hydrolase